MKRQLFNIYVINNQGRGARAVTGYTFFYRGIRCGVSNCYIDSFGSIARGCEWKITELSTGAFFATGASMKEAVTAGMQFIDENREKFTDAIRKNREKYGMTDINEKTRVQYDFLTVK